MVRRSLLMLLASAVIACLASTAQASLTIVPLVGGQPVSGVNYVTFDSLSLGGGGGVAPNTAGSVNPGGSITVSFTPDAQVVQGAASGLYAAPVLSNGNGANFDGQPNGVDATRYITSGAYTSPHPTAAATLTFSSNQMYLGLLWGSVDLYNTLEFFDGLTSVGTITGGQINPIATGDQGINGTYYVNINSTLGFNRVVATSSQYAFEFDNVAYGASQIIPEATTIVVWSVLGLIGVAGRRRHD